ncbi:hypothetical protein VZG28_07755 [Synechococcus elongatus IITB4]|uniref:hypothetical protein n=1 Tax=Synechococcus elongatus TaxID=32046 RepID=UPI0030CC2C49
MLRSIRPFSLALFATLLIGATLTPGRAQTPAAANTVFQSLAAAATRQDAKAIANLYSPSFQPPDGLDRVGYDSAMQRFWKQFPGARYTVQVLNSQPSGSGLQVETLTKIEGQRKQGDRTFNLASEIKSRWLLQDGRLQREEILSERSRLSSGSNPPELTVNAPATVLTGENFSFDAYVDAPLNDDLLVGGVTEDPIELQRLLNPTDFRLQALTAGGVYKQARAPQRPGNFWISALVIRRDGLTVVSERLRVVDRTRPNR